MNQTVVCKQRHALQELPVICQGRNDVLHIIGKPVVLRDDAVQAFVHSVWIVCRSDFRCHFLIVLGKVVQKFAHSGEAVCLGLIDEVSHAAGGAVGHGSAQSLLIDFFTCGLLHGHGTRQIHLTDLVHREDKVRQSR